MVRKQFEFPMKTTKAYQGSDGLKHIIAVASDNRLDLYLEYFDISALSDMVRNCKSTKPNKPSEGLVDLMETHMETFGFGYSTDAWITHTVEKDKDGDFHDVYELYIDFALKEGAWVGEELYNEIKNGEIVKQLSVGGYIENEEDTKWEDVVFEDENGNEVTVQVLKILHFYLEHVATTPEGWAVNPRTRFEDVVKSDNPGFITCIYKSLADENFQKSYKKQEEVKLEKLKNKDTEDTAIEEEDSNKETEAPDSEKGVAIKDIPGIIIKTLREIFEERNKMPNIEKAQELVEELKGLNLAEEDLKKLNLSFVEEKDEETSEEDEPDTPDFSEEIEKSLNPLRETMKSLEEKLNSTEMEEKVKSVTDEISKMKGIFEKALEERDEKIKSLQEQIEELSGQVTPPANEPETKNKSKNQDESDKDEEDDTPERTEKNMWE